MSLRFSHSPQAPTAPSARAFTTLEIMVAMAILATLSLLLLAAAPRGLEKVRTAACANRLRELGIALVLYSSEHTGNFPDAGTTEVSDHVKLASNYVQKLEVMVHCPSDFSRSQAADLATMTDANVSYGYVTHLNNRDSMLLPIAFDRGIGVDGDTLSALSGQGWTFPLHHGGGNLLLNGGEVRFAASFPNPVEAENSPVVVP
ncbi:MAG: hypothetical protein JO317_07860 [Verrucomicrobiae bacterium]|nr:hypothetical protein [Verrucomicrobiae bacterium]